MHLPELLEHVEQWAQARLRDPLNDPSPVLHHREAVEDVRRLRAYLQAAPDTRYPDEQRLVHIFG